MPTKKSTTKNTGPIEIEQAKKVDTHLIIRGDTGLYCHRMSQKASADLLLGGRKKTAADRMLVKHHPPEEFRASMYIDDSKNDHTNVFFPATAIKRAMRTAAIAVPGVTGTMIDRSIFIPVEQIPIYGIPRLRMDIVRSSDINRTPDVRTRAYFAEWGTEFPIRIVGSALTVQTVATLLSNAGLMIGIGDDRQERGHGSYGTFHLVDDLDAIDDLLHAKVAQADAIESPLPDAQHGDTATLLDKYYAEVARRQAA